MPTRHAGISSLRRSNEIRAFNFPVFHHMVGRAAETEPKTKPDAGGVLIEPSEGEIEPGTTLTFTFPTAMVGADRIDVADQALPFVSQPRTRRRILMEKPDRGRFYGPGSNPGGHLPSHARAATSRRQRQTTGSAGLERRIHDASVFRYD